MEYRFSRDDIDRPVAKLNMEAEAFGHFLSIELSGESAISDIDKIRNGITQVVARERWQFEWTGREFHLEASRGEVEVAANLLLQQAHNQEEEDAFASDEEFEAEDQQDCTKAGLAASSGLEDFTSLLSAWRDFLASATTK